MKRPLQLPLAIALALGGTNAFALGLGTIHVNSKLNQPLDADIPVIQGTQGEAEGLIVQLAAAEDFDRVGLSRSRLSVPLEFSVVKGARGDLVIKVRSKDAVREPFLDFLIEANWPKGRLLREYTVLLDPPVMAPATGTAVTSAAKTVERAPTKPLPETKPKASPPKAAPVAAAPHAPAPPPKTTAPAPKHEIAGNEYRVEAGDTLSGIARAVRPDESTNINQLMLALLKQNPNAFFKDNINALKRGAILRIPSAEAIKAVGSASEAAATVHAQIEDWQGGAAAKPTLVADTGTPAPKAPAKPASTATTAKASTAKNSERLELVPPKAGKDSLAMNDRPGGSAGGTSASSEVKAELARTKEALTSREQEANELKSRVKELEETKSKTDRLLGLKDSEIADLQRQLKELREEAAKGGSKTAAPASATKTPTAAATPAGKVSKEDIWGTPSTSDATKAAATAPPAPVSAASTPTTEPATPPASSAPSATSSTPAASKTPAAAPGTTTPSEPSSASSATNASATNASGPGETPASSPATPEASAAGTPTSAPATSATEPAATPSAAPAPAKTASTTPIKSAPKTKTQPLPARTSEWYEQSWVKPAAIGAAALLLLAGLLGMRKRKATTVAPRGSIAGEFGDSPIRGASAAADAEEQALRDQLADDPGNVGLHLELLSLLYAERNVGAFEDAAAAMHAHVVDPHQPEWLEARAMGQELAPHNPLFFDEPEFEEPEFHQSAAPQAFDDEAVTASHATPAFDHDGVFGRTPPSDSAAPAGTAFDFDLDAEAPPAHTPAVPASETTFSFDDLPPIDFTREARHEVEAAAPAPLPVEDDEFAGEDGVGTKLDLAKAYLDMGDPEGARSMLEEVLAEGNDMQKGEARRLMGEIR